MSQMKNPSILLSFLGFAFLIVNAGGAFGQVPSLVAREAVELIVKKFGKEAIEEGPELLAKQIDNVVAKFGDDALTAVQKAGPRALRWIDEAGEAAPQVAKWIAQHGDNAGWVVAKPGRLALASRFGDDAVEAMIKHGEPAEKILQIGGAAAGEAAAKLAPRQGRQLAMLASDATDAALVRNSALMATIAKTGDRGMEFVWKNKGALAVGAVLAAFLANPEPFIDGTKSLAEVAASTAVAPLARGIATGTNWTVVIIALGSVLALYLFAKRRGRATRSVPPSQPVA